LIKLRHLLAASVATCLVFAASTAAAASKCTLIKVADWPIRLERNHLIVDGAINGQTIGVMLDTGAQWSLILRSAAERLGLARQENRGYRLFGLGGETHVEAALVDEFRVGQMTRKNMRLIVAGERDLGSHIDAILGEDFFEQIDVEFDLPHNAVRLFQPKDCEGVVLAYWATQGANETEMEPFHDAGAQIVVRVQVNGQPMHALLDSGASASVLDKVAAERAGITPDSPGVIASGKGGGLGGKAVASWIGPLQSFAIGGETIKDTTIQFADLWKDATYTPIASRLPRKVESPASMLLGADFLRAHRVLVAHSQRKVYFTYEGGPVFQPKAPPEARHASRPETDTKAGAEAK
jgi:predicted aspartyl protease